ncbi:e3 ubiquitin-protein ligase [Gigaspora margarita]|uniref:E3 ubiquitin-protein ligase n=1 Tax=Gigaspora margarita TaxID=4874 RepID=A0A8H4AP38_GIGMA|nr:e3 ubiquitin-protein ligase [Gigaspora margarita]
MRIEAHGTLDLQNLLDELTNICIERWGKTVDQEQNEHYYLTFFSAHHILAFYDFFRSIDYSYDDLYNNFHASNQEIAIDHHILDQIAKNIHPTNGLDSESIKILCSEICDHATCVTSNMSGQNKTQWNKGSSFKSRKAPHTFLISDNINFETLVQQWLIVN